MVPLVLSYHCVLEANYLIDQHLRRTGKEKYFRSKDEFQSISSIMKFLWRVFNSGSDILLNFGQPLDVLGNPVDDKGQSIGKGKVLDIREYFIGPEGIEKNHDRERVYTQTLGEAISEQFKTQNIILTSHLVSFVAFEMLKEDFDNMAIYELISQPEEDYIFDELIFLERLTMMQKLLLDMERKGLLKCADSLHLPVSELLEKGLRKSGVFHTKRPLKRNEDGAIISESFKLLYFYHNRLTAYEFNTIHEPVTAL